jgi:hypothetical protein
VVSAGYRILNPGSDRPTEPEQCMLAHIDRQSLGRLTDRAAACVAILVRSENIGSSKAFRLTAYLCQSEAEKTSEKT